MLYAFLAVPVIYLFAFVAFPVAYNILMSLQEVTLGNITTWLRPWVGLDNYREVIADPSFRAVALNSLIFVGANVAAQLGLGLAVALFFSRRFPGVHFLRGLLLAAWMLPALVVGALWKWLFATQYGVVNFVLVVLGFVREPVHWLADPSLSQQRLAARNVGAGIGHELSWRRCAANLDRAVTDGLGVLDHCDSIGATRHRSPRRNRGRRSR